MTSKLLSIIGAGILGGFVALTPVKAEMTDVRAKAILKESIENPGNCQRDLHCYEEKLKKIQGVVNYFNKQYNESEKDYRSNPSIELAVEIMDYNICRNLSEDAYSLMLMQYHMDRAQMELEKSKDIAEQMSGSTQTEFDWDEATEFWKKVE